jgi:hypothetical protein
MAGFMKLADNDGDVRDLVEDDTLVFEQGGTETPDGRKLVVTIKDGPMGADEGELDFAAADSSEDYGGTHALYQGVFIPAVQHDYDLI